MSFDYEKFEHDLFVAVEEYAKSQLDHKDDIYIMSIDYWPDFTTSVDIRANTYSYLEKQVEKDGGDYLYYKYCEEEWELYEELDEISNELQAEYSEMEKMYSDDEDDEFYNWKKGHAKKIINLCKNVMRKFKETDTYKEYPKLYLNVYVREYFSDEEIIQIFSELNGEEGVEKIMFFS